MVSGITSIKTEVGAPSPDTRLPGALLGANLRERLAEVPGAGDLDVDPIRRILGLGADQLRLAARSSPLSSRRDSSPFPEDVEGTADDAGGRRADDLRVETLDVASSRAGRSTPGGESQAEAVTAGPVTTTRGCCRGSSCRCRQQ